MNNIHNNKYDDENDNTGIATLAASSETLNKENGGAVDRFPNRPTPRTRRGIFPQLVVLIVAAWTCILPVTARTTWESPEDLHPEHWSVCDEETPGAKCIMHTKLRIPRRGQAYEITALMDAWEELELFEDKEGKRLVKIESINCTKYRVRLNVRPKVEENFEDALEVFPEDCSVSADLVQLPPTNDTISKSDNNTSQQTAILTVTLAASNDTQIVDGDGGSEGDELVAQSNFGADEWLTVGRRRDGVVRSLLYFDFTHLSFAEAPEQKQQQQPRHLLRATLQMDQTGQADDYIRCTNENVGNHGNDTKPSTGCPTVHVVTEPWGEGTGQCSGGVGGGAKLCRNATRGEASWTSRSYPLAWQTPGGDFSGLPIGQQRADESNRTFASFPLNVEVLQRIIFRNNDDDNDDYNSNDDVYFGFLVMDDENPAAAIFQSRENRYGRAPRLELLFASLHLSDGVGVDTSTTTTTSTHNNYASVVAEEQKGSTTITSVAGQKPAAVQPESPSVVGNTLVSGSRPGQNRRHWRLALNSRHGMETVAMFVVTAATVYFIYQRRRRGRRTTTSSMYFPEDGGGCPVLLESSLELSQAAAPCFEEDVATTPVVLPQLKSTMAPLI